MTQTFFSFLKKSFVAISPGVKYQHNWHIDVIVNYLQGIAKHKIKRLIINMPPRSMKSICINVAWPAWLLGCNDTYRIISVSYSRALSIKHSLDTRCIMQSEWYRELFPHVQLARDQNTKSKFQTTARGFRLATSIGSTLTGEGGDVLIIDDPLNPIHASREKYKQYLLDWFEQVLMTRLNDRKKGAVIVVMHRICENDLSGYLLAKPGNLWSHLSFPMVAERAQKIYSYNNKSLLYQRDTNELLDKKRYDKKDIAQIKLEIGSYAYAAQYQQAPLPQTRAIIRKEWLRYYDKIPDTSNFIQTWDTASSMHGDYSVGITIAEKNNSFYILEVTRGKWLYQELKQVIVHKARDWQPYAVLIENKASGQQLLQELQHCTGLPLITINTHENKITRLNRVIAMVESGRLFLRKQTTWLADFEYELLSFPNSSHDDQVDSLVQYLQWAKNRMYDNLRIRTL